MTFKDPNGILDHVYFTAEWAVKGPVEGLANMLIANVYAKHPMLIPKPTFVPLIEEKKIEVIIGPDLTKFNNSFQLIGQEMNKLSNIMVGEFKVAMDNLKPSMESMAEFVQFYGLGDSNKTAQYVLKHEGMKTQHKCPQQGCAWSSTSHTLERTIIHLNDVHKWKRESIADWLDTLDEQPVFYPAIEGAE